MAKVSAQCLEIHPTHKRKNTALTDQNGPNCGVSTTDHIYRVYHWEVPV